MMKNKKDNSRYTVIVRYHTVNDEMRAEIFDSADLKEGLSDDTDDLTAEACRIVSGYARTKEVVSAGIHAATENEILAKVEKTDDKIFLYHEYAMHDMHSSYAPFLEWIRLCYDMYYKDTMTAEDFLRKCSVYSMHIETLANFIRDDLCSRKEDAMYFEIQYETHRMIQDILGILEYISNEHKIIFIISKLHLAPYSTLRLIKEIIDRTIDIHAVLMYNDEFMITDYKKQVWNELLRSVSNQDRPLEWGRLDSERTMDVQDEFWFDKAYKNEYLIRLRNMYHLLDTFINSFFIIFIQPSNRYASLHTNS